MNWDSVGYIMETHVEGSLNVMMLRIKRTGKSDSAMGPVDQFKMTLGTTGHYKEAAGHSQTITVSTVPDAEEWIIAREEEGGPARPAEAL